jgi:hypothetical protein
MAVDEGMGRKAFTSWDLAHILNISSRTDPSRNVLLSVASRHLIHYPSFRPSPSKFETLNIDPLHGKPQWKIRWVYSPRRSRQNGLFFRSYLPFEPILLSKNTLHQAIHIQVRFPRRPREVFAFLFRCAAESRSAKNRPRSDSNRQPPRNPLQSKQAAFLTPRTREFCKRKRKVIKSR